MPSALVRLLSLTLLPAVLSAQAPDSTRRDTAAVRVPRGTRVTGARLDSLPIDDPASAFAHIPGVFLRGGDVGISPDAGFSIRGGAVNGVATYIDGAPVRSQLMIDPFITPALNGIGSVEVNTGLAGAELSDGQGGVVSYETPSGGDRLVTRWTAHTDEPFTSPVSVGYNRFSGLVSGPVPGMQGLTVFASGLVQGQGSEYLGAGAQNVPTYVLGGLDTTLQLSNGGGGGTTSFAVPRYVQSSGSCDAATNGAACQGIFRPMDWRTQIQLQGKVRWSYGQGSSVSVTGLATGVQSRQFPGVLLGDPLLFTGEHDWSRLAVLDWHHVLNDALSVEAVMSWGTNRFIQGALDPASEADTRNPSLGIELSTLGVSSGGLGFPVSDQLLRNIRTGSGPVVPYPGRSDLSDAALARLNPYAMEGGNFYAQGVDAPLAFATERQLTGRWQVAWRHAAHLVTVGADAGASELGSYSTFSTINETGLDAWTASPRRFGVFAADDVSIGRVALDAGLRFDHVNVGGALPVTPGFIFNNPGWSPLAATNDTAYAASVARVFQSTRGQGFVSPRLRAATTLGPTTAIALSAGEQLEMPPIAAILSNANSDLAYTSSAALFGRDVAYAASRMVELDVHQTLPLRDDIDVAVYYRGHIPNYGDLIQSFDDPTNCSIVNGQRTCRQVNLTVLEQTGTTHVWGLELAAQQQVTDQMRFSGSYSLFKMGDDPGIIFGAQPISGVTGTVLPPGGGAPGPGASEQAFAFGLDASVSESWAAAGWRSALQHVALVAQFRLISGIPLNQLILSSGPGALAPGPDWTKYLDLRLTKGVRANGLDWTIFADFRNLLNTQNVNGVFGETGGVTDPLFEVRTISNEYSSLAGEAQSNGALNGDGSISLANCGAWAGQYGPLDCVMLQRAEARFGNGDGTYTQAEQTKAFDSFYQMLNGAWRLLGPQRTIRVGLELAF